MDHHIHLPQFRRGKRIDEFAQFFGFFGLNFFGIFSEVYEPYLMKCGLIKRTSRGRVLTEKGLKYIERIIYGKS